MLQGEHSAILLILKLPFVIKILRTGFTLPVFRKATVIPSLDNEFVPNQDRSKVLEYLNTWTEPVPIQPGPPQHLGPGPSTVLILVQYKFSISRVGISGATAKSRQRKFVPSSHPGPFALVASSHKSLTNVGTLACFDFL